MLSADLFLRLLEEKDLVSADVLQAARRETQHLASPPDAVRISLWLVQGQHITAAQADRLLSALAEKTDPAGPAPSAPKKFQATGPKPKQPAAPSMDDLELAPMEDEGKGNLATFEPAKPSRPSSSAKNPAAVPRTNSPGKGQAQKSAAEGAKSDKQEKKSPVAVAKKEKQDKKNPAEAKIGGELESLENTMKGPLDALIESEGLASTAFDDPLGGSQLNPAAPKKFKLRRFLKKLFRRDKSKVVRIKATDPRQVKIVLFSWGVAVALLLGMLTLFWFLSPRSSGKILQEAETAVVEKDYSQAIRLYDEFLKYYSKDSNADDIRVWKGFAELRVAEEKAAAAGDWLPAFEVAQALVKALPMNNADPDVLQKFGITLAKIGEGLARQSQDHADQKTVNCLQAVIDMLETKIPERVRPVKMIEEIQGVLQHDRQEVDSQRELERAADEIRTFAADNDLKAAYKSYQELVRLYPELADNDRLTGAMKQVSAAEKKTIKPLEQSLAAVHEERPSGVLAAMPLIVQPLKGELAEGRGKLVLVVEQGTVYGLDAATGKTVWRRFVALDAKFPAVSAALPLVGPAANDVVLCDPVHQELLCVRGATGALVWRLAVGSPIVAEPVRAGKWLLLPTNDHRLLQIDLATGNSSRYFRLPGAVRLSPVVDTVHGLIFLVADALNVIVLDGGPDLAQCRQVLHVGHEAGKIAASPAVMGDFLLLPVNDAPGKATIRMLAISTDKQGEPLRPVQRIPLEGYVDTAPVAVGRGAAVVTAEGSLFAIRQNEADERLPCQIVASRPVSLKEKSMRYAISDGSKFWVADKQLTRYDIRADKHLIVPDVMTVLGVKYVQPPVIEGGTMFQVLQRPGMPGATVSAFDLKTKEAVWQTWVAAPLVAEPVLGPISGKLTLVTASGGMFRQPLDSLKPVGKPWEPLLAIEAARLTRPLRSLLPLPGERFAMTSGADTTQIVIYDPKEQVLGFRRLNSKFEMSVAPGGFAGGIMTPCINGQIYLLDPEARPDIAKPLEPSVKGTHGWEWQTPVAIDDKRAVLTDGDRRLMVVGITDGEEKALAEAKAITVRSSLVSPLAVLGKLVFVAGRDAAGTTDTLLSFDLPDLIQGKSQVIEGRCAWGPQRKGKFVLVATDTNRLFAIDERGEVVWRSTLGYGPLAGEPCLSGNEIFLSARGGAVWRISAADGKELGKIDVGCPLGTGPLVIGARVIVGGHDGSLLEVKRP